MTVGMEQDQILSSIMLLEAIPVRQCEGLLTLHDLSAARTASCLLVQECCTKRRGRLPRQLSLSFLKVGLPVGVEWLGVALDLTMTLGFDRCWSPDDLVAGCWLRKAPGVPRLMGKVALGEPVSRFVRVAELGPALEPSPDETVQVCKRLATDNVAVGVRPAPKERVACLDEVCRCLPGGLVTEGVALRFDGLHPGLTGGNLQLGWFAMRSGLLTDRLP
jgi:hypothetical protein